MDDVGGGGFSRADRVEAVRRCEALRGLPEPAIAALASRLEPRRCDDLQRFVAGDLPSTLRLIVQGGVLVHAAHGGGEPRRLLGSGQVFGAEALLDAALAAAKQPPCGARAWDAYAVEPGWVLELPAEHTAEVAEAMRDPAALAALRRAVDEPGAGADEPRRGPLVVLVLASEHVRATLPLRPLTLALARTLVEHLAERVQVIHVERGRAGEDASRLGVPDGAAEEIGAAVADALARRVASGEREVLLVDASALAPDAALARALARAVRGLPARTRLSYLFAEPEAWHRLPGELGAACVGEFVLPTVVLAPERPAGVVAALERCRAALDEAETRGPERWVAQARALPQVARAQLRRWVGLERGAIGAAGRRRIDVDPSARATRPVWPREAVRLRLSAAARAELRRRDGRPLAGEAWSPAAWIAAAGGEAGDREGLERWGRALTGRRVGVAIGGAGALSYVGVALLRALRAAKVPIDVVSGTSFGAVVAAYYAALGEPGLELLERRWSMAQLTVALGWITPRPFEWWIDHDLGGIDGAELEVPVVPVTTNARNGHAWELRAGPLGRLCAMSGAMPPLAPSHDGELRFLDGALTAVVPGRALVEAGADMVVGANVLPYPREREEAARSGVARLLRGVDPTTRIADAVRSYLLLFRQASASQAEHVDVMYAAESPVGNGATFYRREELIEHAARSRSLAQAVARARERWQQLLAGV